MAFVRLGDAEESHFGGLKKASWGHLGRGRNSRFAEAPRLFSLRAKERMQAMSFHGLQMTPARGSQTDGKRWHSAGRCIPTESFYFIRSRDEGGREDAAAAPGRAQWAGSRFFRYAFGVVLDRVNRALSENKENHVKLNFSSFATVSRTSPAIHNHEPLMGPFGHTWAYSCAAYLALK